MPNPDAGTERANPTTATTAPPASDRIPGPWSRIPRWTPDVVVAVAATLYTLPLLPEHAESGPRLAALVILALAIAASLPWRRARPLPVLAIMLVAAAGHLVLGAPLVAADVLLLVAVYTVSSRHDRTRSLPAAALVIVWLLGATMTDLGTDYLNVGEVASLILLVILVWTWGAFVRIRRAHIAALEDRAQRLEHERDTRERLAAAAERARLAREIHDVVSHGLGVVVVMSEGAAATVDTDADRAPRGHARRPRHRPLCTHRDAISPVLLAVLASRQVEIEHSGNGWLASSTSGVTTGQLCRAKFDALGLLITLVTIAWVAILIGFGTSIGIMASVPVGRWAGYAVPLVVINLAVLACQILLSARVENQLMCLGIGVVGVIVAVFGAVLPTWAAHLVPWGYYSLVTPVDFVGTELVYFDIPYSVSSPSPWSGVACS